MRSLLAASLVLTLALALSPTGRAESPSSLTFCTQDALANCPCGNPGDADSGCDVPIPAMQGGGTTGGVRLLAVAQTFTPLNRATFTATGFPPASTPSGVLFRNVGIDPVSPVVFGDGLRCVDAALSPGTLVRIGPALASGGQSVHTFGHGSMAGPGTFYYQLWFRSTPASYCNPSTAFNLSNGITLNW